MKSVFRALRRAAFAHDLVLACLFIVGGLGVAAAGVAKAQGVLVGSGAAVSIAATCWLALDVWPSRKGPKP